MPFIDPKHRKSFFVGSRSLPRTGKKNPSFKGPKNTRVRLPMLVSWTEVLMISTSRHHMALSLGTRHQIPEPLPCTRPSQRHRVRLQHSLGHRPQCQLICTTPSQRLRVSLQRNLGHRPQCPLLCTRSSQRFRVSLRRNFGPHRHCPPLQVNSQR